MFVVLRMIKPKKRILKRLRQKKLLSEAEVITCPTENGLPFFLLNVLENKNGADWDLVAQKCGRYASRIVASRSFSLPDHGKLKRFVPVSMPATLIFNTAAEIIKKADLPPEGISITLTDRNATHVSRLCELLPFAACIRVITTHPERYASACQKAFDEFGASIIIRSTYEPTAKPDIVICCDGIISAMMNAAAVFTSKQKSCGKLRFYGKGIELSEVHKELLPPDIDPIDFAGALTELCGSSEYKNAVFADVETDCTLCNKKNLEKCLKCYCSGSTVSKPVTNL